MPDIPTDPYECERCRWDWRKRTFASFCREHQRRAAEDRPVARFADMIPLIDSPAEILQQYEPDTETPLSGPRFPLSYERVSNAGTPRG